MRSDCVCVACRIGMCDIVFGNIVCVCVVSVSVWHVRLACVTYLSAISRVYTMCVYVTCLIGMCDIAVGNITCV